MTELRTGILVIFLVVCSCLDIRFGRFPIWFLCMGVALGALLEIAENGFGILFFRNMIPGVVLLLISAVVPNHLGAGDGFMLMGVGSLAGWKTGVILLEGGLLLMFPLAFFWAVVKKRRKREIPFAPFLLGACFCRLILL